MSNSRIAEEYICVTAYHTPQEPPGIPLHREKLLKKLSYLDRNHHKVSFRTEGRTSRNPAPKHSGPASQHRRMLGSRAGSDGDGWSGLVTPPGPGEKEPIASRASERQSDQRRLHTKCSGLVTLVGHWSTSCGWFCHSWYAVIILGTVVPVNIYSIVLSLNFILLFIDAASHGLGLGLDQPHQLLEAGGRGYMSLLERKAGFPPHQQAFNKILAIWI